tara:strand:- start:219 stop:917 length:699 start_codon:yes stop_codon:yes gene_type:complete
MGLPILKHPTFELMVPSTKQTLKYRPFLVKEEKILLLAQQGGTANDLIRAINQIIEACVEDVDVNKLASFDTEYIFLQLRANSVSELAKINIQDEEIDDWVEVEVDLHDVIVPEIEMDNKVELADDIFIELRYPRYVDMMRLDEDDELNTNIEMIAMCIDKVYEGEEVMEMSSFSKEEQEVFINSFSADAFAKVQEFFVNMPKVSMEAKYKIKVDGKNKTKKRKLEGINDFF